MQVTKKKYLGVWLGAAALFAMLVLFICLPQATFGAQSEGGEKPYLYCTYKDGDGNIVDGNNLAAGETYEVSFVVDNLSQAAVIQMTATYSEEVRVAAAPSSLLSETVANMSSMGYVLGDGNIVFGFVSDETDYSAFDDSIVLATVDITFTNGGDAENYITFSENPNLTFICTSHSDYVNEYAINAGAGYEYDGLLYEMTAEVSPSFGHTVSGALVIATGTNDATNGNAVYGEYTVSVYSDSTEEALVTEVTSVYDTTGDSPVNTFTLNNLTAGTYYAVITSQYSIARHVTIQVTDSDIVAGDIAMICCDYSMDGFITANDAKTVYTAAGSGGEIAKYCELNGDGYVTSGDAKLVYNFASSSQYPQLIIS